MDKLKPKSKNIFYLQPFQNLNKRMSKGDPPNTLYCVLFLYKVCEFLRRSLYCRFSLKVSNPKYPDESEKLSVLRCFWNCILCYIDCELPFYGRLMRTISSNCFRWLTALTVLILLFYWFKNNNLVVKNTLKKTLWRKMGD